jgi:hypothetical protein
MAENQPPAEQGHKRRLKRRRVLMTGIIAFNRHFTTVRCQVRDFTDTGAHLRCDNFVHVPQKFDLIIELESVQAACEIAWRKDKDIGVHFLNPPARIAAKRRQIINPIMPPSAPSLRRHPPT